MDAQKLKDQISLEEFLRSYILAELQGKYGYLLHKERLGEVDDLIGHDQQKEFYRSQILQLKAARNSKGECYVEPSLASSYIPDDWDECEY